MTGWDKSVFESLLWKKSFKASSSQCKCLSGVYRVWEASEFWKLCHKTAVFKGEAPLKVTVGLLSEVEWSYTMMSVYLSVCLQLLGELLLDRYNFTVMTKYISKPENLKLMMNLLRDNSRNIQFEAFHVFKVKQLMFAVTSDSTRALFCPNGISFPSPRFLLQTQTKLNPFWTYCWRTRLN